MSQFISPAENHRVAALIFNSDAAPTDLSHQQAAAAMLSRMVADGHRAETVSPLRYRVEYGRTGLMDLYAEHRVTHTPLDSLIIASRMVNGLLDTADEYLHGVHDLEHSVETEELPEHVQVAVEMIRGAARIIQHEATLHGAYSRRFYDNGIPTTEVRQEPHLEPQEDGTESMVLTDLHYDLYPDGKAFHPISRNTKEN